jgi:hypothetical protein
MWGDLLYEPWTATKKECVFRGNPDSHSDASRTVIPIDAGHFVNSWDSDAG